MLDLRGGVEGNISLHLPNFEVSWGGRLLDTCMLLLLLGTTGT